MKGPRYGRPYRDFYVAEDSIPITRPTASIDNGFKSILAFLLPKSLRLFSCSVRDVFDRNALKSGLVGEIAKPKFKAVV